MIYATVGFKRRLLYTKEMNHQSKFQVYVRQLHFLLSHAIFQLRYMAATHCITGHQGSYQSSFLSQNVNKINTHLMSFHGFDSMLQIYLTID